MKHDLAQLKTAYDNITSLYDVADSLIGGVNKQPENKQEAYFNLVNPLVEQLESSADILTEEFLHMAENDTDQPCKRSRKAVETTLRNTYAAFDLFQKTLANAKGEAAQMLQSLLPLLQRAKDTLGQVIAAFLQFAELSLDRVMQKAELEALKAKEPAIAALLHQMSQGRS